MKNNRIDQVILYVVVACFILIIAAIVRLFALKEGFDGFSLMIIFIVTIAVLTVVYLSIHSFLERLMLPIIAKLLAKIPFVRRKIKRREQENIYDVEYEEIPERAILVEPNEKTEHTKADNEEKIQALVEEDNTGEQVDTIIPQTLSLEEIHQEQLQKRALEQEEQINTAIEYIKKTFVLYTSEKDLEVLIQNLHIYINNMDLKELKPIKVKELLINDLRHFGWNIWNHFKPRNQMDIAHFLKDVFPDVFKDAEVESIKGHLRDDEKKGIIKIEKKLAI